MGYCHGPFMGKGEQQREAIKEIQNNAIYTDI